MDWIQSLEKPKSWYTYYICCTNNECNHEVTFTTAGDAMGTSEPAVRTVENIMKQAWDGTATVMTLCKTTP